VSPEPDGEPAELTDEQADKVALFMAAAFGPEQVARVRETIRKREEAKRGNPGGTPDAAPG
jgi:hypothetical protein